jgi:glutamate mutase epsilon subunit
MAKKRTAKRARAATKSLSPNCKVLAGGIKKTEQDIVATKKSISAQERFIQQLVNAGAKPVLIAQARQRLTTLNETLEDDEGQLQAFKEEFAADCH